MKNDSTENKLVIGRTTRNVKIVFVVVHFCIFKNSSFWLLGKLGFLDKLNSMAFLAIFYFVVSIKNRADVGIQERIMLHKLKN